MVPFAARCETQTLRRRPFTRSFEYLVLNSLLNFLETVLPKAGLIPPASPAYAHAVWAAPYAQPAAAETCDNCCSAVQKRRKW